MFIFHAGLFSYQSFARNLKIIGGISKIKIDDAMTPFRWHAIYEQNVTSI